MYFYRSCGASFPPCTLSRVSTGGVADRRPAAQRRAARARAPSSLGGRTRETDTHDTRLVEERTTATVQLYSIRYRRSAWTRVSASALSSAQPRVRSSRASTRPTPTDPTRPVPPPTAPNAPHATTPTTRHTHQHLLRAYPHGVASRSVARSHWRPVRLAAFVTGEPTTRTRPPCHRPTARTPSRAHHPWCPFTRALC